MSASVDILRRDILARALTLAPFEGWTTAMLEKASPDALALRRTFPGGVIEALDFLTRENDRKMLEAVQAYHFPTMKVRERIRTCVKARLEQELPHREAVRRAVAHLALPQNVFYATQFLWRTADEIWHAGGDASTDFNWYTKRWLLTKVYAATLLYWLDDKSEDRQATWEFLDRRIANVLSVGKWIGRGKEQAGKLGDFLTERMRKAANY